MWLDRVSNPGPLVLESDALPTAQCGPDNAEKILKTVAAKIITETVFKLYSLIQAKSALK